MGIYVSLNLCNHDKLSFKWSQPDFLQSFPVCYFLSFPSRIEEMFHHTLSFAFLKQDTYFKHKSYKKHLQ